MGLENGISKRVSNYIIDFDTDEYGDVVTWMVKEGAKLIFGDDNTEVPMFVDAEDLKRSIYLVLR